jgi:GTP-binding protein
MAQLTDKPEFSVSIGGKEYKFSELPIDSLGSLQAWVKANTPHPLAAIKDYLEGLPLEDRRYLLEREIEQNLSHVAWAPRVNISAKTGRHLEKLVPALEVALDSWDQRIATGKLNAFIQELTMETPHPVRGGKQPRILFATQVSVRPPKFVLFTTGFLEEGYRRFITRRLRETYGFEGSPVEIGMRVREKRKRT